MLLPSLGHQRHNTGGCFSGWRCAASCPPGEESLEPSWRARLGEETGTDVKRDGGKEDLGTGGCPACKGGSVDCTSSSRCRCSQKTSQTSSDSALESNRCHERRHGHRTCSDTRETQTRAQELHQQWVVVRELLKPLPDAFLPARCVETYHCPSEQGGLWLRSGLHG